MMPGGIKGASGYMAFPTRSPAEAAQDRALYGDAIADVNLLRQRGYCVIREGKQYRVDNHLISVAELRRKAVRERRLAAPGRSWSGPSAASAN